LTDIENVVRLILEQKAMTDRKMHVTKRHFERVAALLKDQIANYRELAENTDEPTKTNWLIRAGAVEAMATVFADEFADCNPRFDRERFFNAVHEGEER